MSEHARAFKLKLSVLTDKKESINHVGDWVIFHESKFRESVAIWNEQLHLVAHEQVLNYLWVCDNILRRWLEKSQQEFQKYLPAVVNFVRNALDPKEVPRIDRLLDVWQEKNVFPLTFIQSLRGEDITPKPLPLTHPLVTSLRALADSEEASNSQEFLELVATSEGAHSATNSMTKNVAQIQSRRLSKQVTQRTRLIELLQQCYEQEQTKLDQARKDLDIAAAAITSIKRIKLAS